MFWGLRNKERNMLLFREEIKISNSIYLPGHMGLIIKNKSLVTGARKFSTF